MQNTKQANQMSPIVLERAALSALELQAISLNLDFARNDHARIVFSLLNKRLAAASDSEIHSSQTLIEQAENKPRVIITRKVQV